jgi:hypothetical protein
MYNVMLDVLSPWCYYTHDYYLNFFNILSSLCLKYVKVHMYTVE